MGWPSSPINGQTAVVNGITYTYDSSRTAWIRSSSTTFNLFTASNIAPTTPSLGDQWYYIATDILYEYISDGTSSYWVDTDSLGQVGNVTNIADSTLQGNLVVGVDTRYSIGASNGYLRNLFANSVTANSITVNGDILPSANVVYNLGSSSQRFKDLWLSGNTIYLGGANISAIGSNVTITNPQGASANVTFGNVFGNYYFANGAAFSSSSFGNADVAAYLRSGTGLGSNTDAIVLPIGTTEQRPTATNGMMRYNSSINGGSIEAYLGGNWVTIASANYQVGFLIVAGGGGGGGRIGAGGGAGGVLVGNIAQSVIPGSSYTVVIGAGGTAGAAQVNGPGGDGGNSSVFSFVAVGGGGGAGTDSLPGRSGGSGGGGSRVSLAALGGASTQSTPPSGLVTAYGNAGGAGSGAPDRSGGGGGAGAAGATGTASGNGGNGIVNPIPGSTVGQLISTNYWIAGGGGGSAFSNPATGSGGNGGGGAGNTSAPGTAGTAATGGGGGGGGYTGEPGMPGGAGGSGAVVIYYVSTTQRGSGGTVTSTTVGPTTYYLHTFTSTGTFTFTAQ